MKLCIFGSRDVMPSMADISYAVSLIVNLPVHEMLFPQDDEVVCGMAQGADTAGMLWARSKDIRVREFPAKWTQHGQAAGFVRNELMARYCTHGLCWWRKNSRGTANMIAWLNALEKPCKVVLV